MVQETILNEIVEWGRSIYSRGYVHGSAGNISVRVRDIIFITRHGVSLRSLSMEDVVPVSLGEKGELDHLASIELPIHREIYRVTGSSAIIHAHPVYTIVLSFEANEVKPIDVEGSFHLGSVSVVEGTPGSDSLAKAVSTRMGEKGIVVIRGHGVFSAGETLREAFEKIDMLEGSSKIIYLYKGKAAKP